MRIQLDVIDDAARVSVSDDGIGIAPDVLPRLFGRFFRTEEARERHLPGLGLGLHVTKSLVDAHGGHIWATSDGLGTGSTFGFTLPYRDAGAS